MLASLRVAARGTGAATALLLRGAHPLPAACSHTCLPSLPPATQAFRDNDRIEFSSTEFADAVWESCGLRHLLEGQLEDEGGVAVGLNPRIRIYRYSGKAVGVCAVHRHCAVRAADREAAGCSRRLSIPD